MIKYLNLKGIAQILILLGLLAAVGVGVSKAAGKTVACDGQTLSGQSPQSKADFFAIYGDNAAEEWVAEHERDLIIKGIPCKNPGGYAPGIGTGSNANKASPVCKEPEAVKNTYYDAKVANNLVRFYAILEGVGGLCVPADLGVGTQENAEAEGGGSGRLLLCSGSDGALVWKAVVENKLKTAKKDAPSRDTIEGGFTEKLNEAKSKVGL